MDRARLKRDFSLVQVDKQLIDDLLVCYLRNSSCSRFHAVVNELSKGLLRETPYPLYVSVDAASGTTSGSTALSYLTLAHLTGQVRLLHIISLCLVHLSRSQRAIFPKSERVLKFLSWGRSDFERFLLATLNCDPE